MSQEGDYYTIDELKAKVDRHLFDAMLEYGFTENQCLHALLAPGVRNLDSAVDWLTQQPEEVVMFPPIVPRAAEAKASATTDSSAAVTESTPMSARAQPTEVITETGSVVAAASTDSATTTVTVGTADSTATAAAKQEETEDEEAKEIYKQAIKSPLSFHYKMILGVRMDTAMEKGKMMAQCAHAAVGMVLELVPRRHKFLEGWLIQGQAKIVVKVPNYEEMMKLAEHASRLNIPNFIVYDQGRTQIAAGTATVIAIGPAPIPLVDKVTKHLKLM